MQQVKVHVNYDDDGGADEVCRVCKIPSDLPEKS